MYDFTCLVRRNILKFLRDKTAVFFSMLSVIILLALYFLFIGKQYTNASELDFISDGLKTYLGVGVIMGGVLVINTVSLSLGVMGNLIMDIDQKRLDGFLVTPVKRYKIILSYYVSSFVVTMILTLIMWFLTILYVGIFAGYWYAVDTIMTASLLIIFYTLVSTTLMIFLVTLLKSVNAFGALSGVLGTLIGFMSGIYMPIIVLGNAMAKVASLIPFTHMTILLKQVLLRDAYQELGPQAEAALAPFYGTLEIGVVGYDVHMLWMMSATVLIAGILLYFSYRKLNRKMAS